jgi:hypothetical protein
MKSSMSGRWLWNIALRSGSHIYLPLFLITLVRSQKSHHIFKLTNLC